MKLEFEKDAPPPVNHYLKIGDVYPAKGGTPTRYWLCVGLTRSGQTGHMIGFNEHGEVSSTASYNAYAMEYRTRVGTVNLSALNLTLKPVGDTHE